MKQNWICFVLVGLLAGVAFNGCSSTLTDQAFIRSAPPETLPGLEQELQQKLVADQNDTDYLFSLARVLLRQGKLEEAEKLAGRLSHLLPFDGSALSLLGEVFLEKRNFIRAQAAFDHALKLDPGLLETEILMSRALLGIGDVKTAEKRLEATIRNNPVFLPARFQLADLHLKSGQLQNAEKGLREALLINPNNPEGHLIQIRVLIARGRHNLAVSLIDEGLKNNPEDIALIREKAELFIQRGDWQGALKIISELYRMPVQKADVQLLQSRVLIEMGQTAEGEDILREILKKYPRHFKSLLFMAMRELEKHNPTEALSILRRAQELEPGNTRGQLIKAVAHLRLGEDTQGKAIIQNVGKTVSAHPVLSRLKIRVAISEGRIAEAEQLTNNLLAVSSDDQGAKLLRVELLTIQGSPEMALKILGDHWSSGHQPGVHFSLARLAFIAGDYKTVLQHTTELMKRKFFPWQVVYFHALALGRTRKTAEAMELINPLLEKNLGNGYLHGAASEISIMEGKSRAAMGLLRKGLIAFPGNLRLIDEYSRLALEEGDWGTVRRLLEPVLDRSGSLRSKFLGRLQVAYGKLKQPEKSSEALREYFEAGFLEITRKEVLGWSNPFFGGMNPYFNY